MERYINPAKIRLTAVGSVDENGDVLVSMADVRKAIAQTPSADVVPRAEVERLQAEIAQLQIDLHYSVCREDKAKTEVAREIFDDIAKMMVLQHGFNEKHIVAHIDFELLKELKKKYTEGET